MVIFLGNLEYSQNLRGDVSSCAIRDSATSMVNPLYLDCEIQPHHGGTETDDVNRGCFVWRDWEVLCGCPCERVGAPGDTSQRSGSGAFGSRWRQHTHSSLAIETACPLRSGRLISSRRMYSCIPSYSDRGRRHARIGIQAGHFESAVHFCQDHRSMHGAGRLQIAL